MTQEPDTTVYSLSGDTLAVLVRGEGVTDLAVHALGYTLIFLAVILIIDLFSKS